MFVQLSAADWLLSHFSTKSTGAASVALVLTSVSTDNSTSKHFRSAASTQDCSMVCLVTTALTPSPSSPNTNVARAVGTAALLETATGSPVVEACCSSCGAESSQGRPSGHGCDVLSHCGTKLSHQLLPVGMLSSLQSKSVVQPRDCHVSESSPDIAPASGTAVMLYCFRSLQHAFDPLLALLLPASAVGCFKQLDCRKRLGQPLAIHASCSSSCNAPKPSHEDIS
mmetsp:Transcript_43342/g.114303  ORF Transcript_43342/g.114303 Transcript_43342/m.114303 type:complete len:226 (-) Transcript_43342:255-932(-)